MVDTTTFLTRFVPQGHVYLWFPHTLWLSVLADSIIAVACFSLPVILVIVLRRRLDVQYRNLVYMFSAFIIACGLTSLMGIGTVWNVGHDVQALFKGAAALISIATAVMLIPVLPRLLALKSLTELESTNRDLQAEIAVHQKIAAHQQHAKTKFRTFLEQAPYSVLIINQDSNIEYANAMTGKLFGYAPDNLFSTPVQRLVPEIARDELSGRPGGFFETPHVRPMSVETKGRNEDQREFPIEICLSPIELNGDIMVLATVIDITDEKASEIETRMQLNELAHVSRLATVGQMAAGLAHELNQPLTAISLNCDTALSIVREHKSSNPQLLVMLEENYEYCQRAGQIIRSLRQMVQKGDNAREPGDINKLVITVEKLIHAEATAAGVKVRLHLADDLPQLLLDSVQVQQVLVNLMRNSIEALGQATGRPRKLMISTCFADPDSIMVTVHDNGPGVSPEYAANLFQPYVTTRDRGMGLGLTISRSIVEAHGGVLRLDEADDSGATFCFTLPIAEQQEVES